MTIWMMTNFSLYRCDRIMKILTQNNEGEGRSEEEIAHRSG